MHNYTLRGPHGGGESPKRARTPQGGEGLNPKAKKFCLKNVSIEQRAKKSGANSHAYHIQGLGAKAGQFL